MKMKKGGGGSKGSQYERDISRKLSLWWTQDMEKPRDDVFWRTSGSGARATSRSKKQRKTAYEYGDITFKDPIGKPLIDCFLIECKRGYNDDTDILDLFHRQEKSPIFLWRRKTIGEAEEAGRKHHMIILCRNRKPALALIDYVFHRERICISGNFKGKRIEIFSDSDSFIVMKLDDLLEWIDPETLKMDYGGK